MNSTFFRHGCIGLSLGCALLAGRATAQFTTPAPTQLPTTATQQQIPSNLTPSQIRNILMLRGLQQRAGGGVRTGYPQFIPYGPNFMGNPMMQGQQMQNAQPLQNQNAQGAAPKAGRKSVEERRAAAKESA